MSTNQKKNRFYMNNMKSSERMHLNGYEILQIYRIKIMKWKMCAKNTKNDGESWAVMPFYIQILIKIVFSYMI